MSSTAALAADAALAQVLVGLDAFAAVLDRFDGIAEAAGSSGRAAAPRGE